jgi:hypothetical protein
VVIEPHRHEGVFIARGKEDALVTLNMVPGEAVYGEKRISVDVSSKYRYVIHKQYNSMNFYVIICNADEPCRRSECLAQLVNKCKHSIIILADSFCYSLSKLSTFLDGLLNL